MHVNPPRAARAHESSRKKDNAMWSHPHMKGFRLQTQSRTSQPIMTASPVYVCVCVCMCVYVSVCVCLHVHVHAHVFNILRALAFLAATTGPKPCAKNAKDARSILFTFACPCYIRVCPLFCFPAQHASHICRAGQNCLYTPYMTVYLMHSLPKVPYVHHIYWFWPTLHTTHMQSWPEPYITFSITVHTVCIQVFTVPYCAFSIARPTFCKVPK